ncbi:hypothetical protein H4R33_000960 [Dimargaris cristalligena]|nr:hypothetical protein H4R33_000960 [Dimargaris cristalligena]
MNALHFLFPCFTGCGEDPEPCRRPLTRRASVHEGLLTIPAPYDPQALPKARPGEGRWETWRRKLVATLGHHTDSVLRRSGYHEHWDDDYAWTSPGQLELPTTLHLHQTGIRRELAQVRQIKELVGWLKSLQPAAELCIQTHRAPDRRETLSLPQRSLLGQLEHNWAQATFLIDLVEQSSLDARNDPHYLAGSLRPSTDSGHPLEASTPHPTSTVDSDLHAFSDDEFTEFIPEDERGGPGNGRPSPALQNAEHMSLLNRLMDYRRIIEEQPNLPVHPTLEQPALAYDLGSSTHLPPILFTVDNLLLLASECKALVASVEATLAELSSL